MNSRTQLIKLNEKIYLLLKLVNNMKVGKLEIKDKDLPQNWIVVEEDPWTAHIFRENADYPFIEVFYYSSTEDKIKYTIETFKENRERISRKEFFQTTPELQDILYEIKLLKEKEFL